MNRNHNGKYTIDAAYFDKIDTEDKTYFLGLLYADGCNYENGNIKIDLIEENSYILEKMRECMKCNRPLSHYAAETKIINGQPCDCKASCRFQINCHHMSEVLKDYGVVPHKSECGMYIKDDIVPDYLFHHWVRGLIDGDGGISYWCDNETTGHRKFQVNFCSTVDIVTNLAKYIGNKFGCMPSISSRYPDRDNNNLQFNICGNQVVRRILDWLYDGATIYLQRKYNRYQELIKENERKANDKTLYGSMHPRREVINLNTNKIYESVSSAAKDIGKCSSFITLRARAKNEWMYLDEYKKVVN